MGLLDIPSDGDYYLDLHGMSRHSEPMEKATPWQPEKRYNETNPGLGLTYQWGDDLKKFLTAGYYKNSLSDQSNYVGGGMRKEFDLPLGLHAGLGALGGVITGYPGGPQPVVLPQVSLGGDKFGLNLMYAPRNDKSPETYMLSTQFKF